MGLTLPNGYNRLNQYSSNSKIHLLFPSHPHCYHLDPENDDRSAIFLNSLKEDEQLDENGLLPIKQNEEGIDLEDRVERLNNFIKGL